jgi:hypothetical protein
VGELCGNADGVRVSAWRTLQCHRHRAQQHLLWRVHQLPQLRQQQLGVRCRESQHLPGSAHTRSSFSTACPTTV